MFRVSGFRLGVQGVLLGKLSADPQKHRTLLGLRDNRSLMALQGFHNRGAFYSGLNRTLEAQKPNSKAYALDPQPPNPKPLSPKPLNPEPLNPLNPNPKPPNSKALNPKP